MSPFHLTYFAMTLDLILVAATAIRRRGWRFWPSRTLVALVAAFAVSACGQGGKEGPSVGVLLDPVDTSKRETGFLVDSAELEDPGLFDRMPRTGRRSSGGPYHVEAHRVREGRGTVLGYRWWSEGSPVVIDDEKYRKVTIWHRDGLPDEGVVSLDDEAMLALYSSGGSAWPEIGCYGRISTGTLRFRTYDEDHVLADLDVSLRPKETGRIDKEDNGWCEPVDLRLRLVLGRTEVEKLTPWEGSAADHIYGETYPPE
ncbi:MAG: hypothetical protein IH892_21355 [Planctomycetes bacterium]|nr:hypothetical protein [Planctomycetota bacterium]